MSDALERADAALAKMPTGIGPSLRRMIVETVLEAVGISSLERELAEARAPKRWEVVRQYHPSTGGENLLTIHGAFDTYDAALIAALVLNQGGTFGANAYVRPLLSTTRSDGEAK